MRRYWVPRESLSADQAHIEGEIFHHIFSVCRQDVGSRFEILCGDQKAHLVEVTAVGKKSAQAKVISSREVPALPTPHLHLALSISRYPVMDAIVEKAVEMGVHTIHPFFSDFSFIRKDTKLPESKIERWQKIIVSATQQSGRGELMEMKSPVTLEQIQQKFNQTKGRLGLFAYEGDATKSLAQALKTLDRQNLTEVWVFVGSEGGFSAEEVKGFQSLGLDPVTLGDQVLRVETACITLLAILKYEFAMR